VLLAEELEAEHCELIKDVGGYFAQDPKSQGQADHLACLSYEQALDMANAGCELIQAQAIETARIARLRLIVRGLDDSSPTSTVSRICP
jgi:aspartokinase